MYIKLSKNEDLKLPTISYKPVKHTMGMSQVRNHEEEQGHQADKLTPIQQVVPHC